MAYFTMNIAYSFIAQLSSRASGIPYLCPGDGVDFGRLREYARHRYALFYLQANVLLIEGVTLNNETSYHKEQHKDRGHDLGCVLEALLLEAEVRQHRGDQSNGVGQRRDTE